MNQPKATGMRFNNSERGAVIAESVIVLPMLVWAYLAMSVYWDAYATKNTVQKATYTIADMISREMNPISGPHVDGLLSVMDFLIEKDLNTTLRVSSITRNESAQRFEVLWSYSPQNRVPVLTTAQLQEIAFSSRIPAMADGDTVVLLEASVGYQPAFDVGLSDIMFREYIVTRPRFVPAICFDAVC
jgi:hypothetical protein